MEFLICISPNISSVQQSVYFHVENIGALLHTECRRQETSLISEVNYYQNRSEIVPLGKKKLLTILKATQIFHNFLTENTF